MLELMGSATDVVLEACVSFFALLSFIVVNMGGVLAGQVRRFWAPNQPELWWPPRLASD